MAARPITPHPMPEIAGFIAQLKAAFGAQAIDAAIRRGKAGEPTFHAEENGHTVGTAGPAQESAWRVDGAVRARHYCRGCDGSCVGTGTRCEQDRNMHSSIQD